MQTIPYDVLLHKKQRGAILRLLSVILHHNCIILASNTAIFIKFVIFMQIPV